MTADEYREIMETELAWRQEEFAFFKNQLNEVPDGQRNRYRKGLMLILQTHLEGYVAICLQTYIQYINSRQLTGSEVSLRLMAAGMQKIKKTEEVREQQGTGWPPEWYPEQAEDADSYPCYEAPADDRLYRFYRQVDLLEKAEHLKGQVLKLDDRLVDLKYGCGYLSVQTNLYRLGIPVGLFQAYQEDLDAFVHSCGSLARGIIRSGVTRQELTEWESKVFRIAAGVMRLLYDYVKQEKYRTDPVRNA